MQSEMMESVSAQRRELDKLKADVVVSFFADDRVINSLDHKRSRVSGPASGLVATRASFAKADVFGHANKAKLWVKRIQSKCVARTLTAAASSITSNLPFHYQKDI